MIKFNQLQKKDVTWWCQNFGSNWNSDKAPVLFIYFFLRRPEQKSDFKEGKKKFLKSDISTTWKNDFLAFQWPSLGRDAHPCHISIVVMNGDN